MFVPVTTKPYLNSVNFIILLQGIPAFFLLIKEKTKPTYYFLQKQDHLQKTGILLPAKTGVSSQIKEDFYNGKSSGI
jgi:hypothetical protein